MIAAISQEPEFKGFDKLIEGHDWIKTDEKYKTKEEGIFSGGDDINLGLVIDAIYHGRMAAAAINEMIANEPMSSNGKQPGVIRADKLMLSYYEASDRIQPAELEPAERLKSMTTEIVSTISRDDAIHEAKRCMSCGYCFDCGNCWSFCQDNAVVKPLVKGEPYKFKLEFCNGCKKCAENCPCGYIEMH